MFGFSSLGCVDCSILNIQDKNNYGEAYCPNLRKYVALDSTPCRDFERNFYVMTAYCKIRGISCDSHEMNTLIALRDNYMINNDTGKEFLEEYESMGPIIATRLMCDVYKMDIVDKLEEAYIYPAIDFVRNNRLEEAQQTYIEMFESLKRRYGYTEIQKEISNKKHKRLY